MNENLSQSPAGARFTKSFENCLKRTPDGRYKPYLCPAGVLTIGWGHTNHHGRKFDSNAIWTRAECDAEFVSDMAQFEAEVRRLVTVPLTQGAFDALVDFTYNVGAGALAGSTLLKKLNRSDYEGAAREFLRWDKITDPKTGQKVSIRGLTRRRASEMLLAQGIADKDYDGKPDATAPAAAGAGDEGPEPDPMPQAIEPPAPPKAMAQSSIGNGEILKGTVAAGTGATAIAKVALDEPSAPTVTSAPSVDSITDLIERGGSVVDTASDIAYRAPQAISIGKVIFTVIGDPLFIAAVTIGVVGLCVFTWFRRRKHLMEDGV